MSKKSKNCRISFCVFRLNYFSQFNIFHKIFRIGVYKLKFFKAFAKIPPPNIRDKFYFTCISWTFHGKILKNLGGVDNCLILKKFLANFDEVLQGRSFFDLSGNFSLENGHDRQKVGPIWNFQKLTVQINVWNLVVMF